MTDTRPILDDAWRSSNPEEWHRLWQQPERCPICMDADVVWDSPMNYSVPTRCCHWLCCDCIYELARRGRTSCPICNDEVAWFFDVHLDDDGAMSD